MDLVRLGERYTTQYVPDALVEFYTSLIWTERFFGYGEFELKSFEVAYIQSLLPEDTLVSHLETREVMIVTTHEINPVGEEGQEQDEITVKGVSLASIFDHRWVESEYGKKRRMRQTYSAKGAAAVLIFNAIDNPSGKDVTRGDPEAEDISKNDYGWTTLDVLPNIAITDSAPALGGGRWWKLEEGILGPQLARILSDEDLSIRTMRPVPGGTSGNVVKVKNMPLEERGNIERTLKTDISALQFDIYQGVDKSGSISFNVSQGQLDKAQYVWSNVNYKTVVEIKSSVGGADVYRPSESGITGLRRRVIGMDGGEPELPDKPEEPAPLRKNASQAERNKRQDDMDKYLDKLAAWKNKRDRIVADFKDENQKEALRMLRKENRRTVVFSGSVTELAPYKYKTDYNLGDSVMIYGDYEAAQKVIVAEYVRAENLNGDLGYPGFVMP